MNPDQYGPDGRPGAADESPPDERALTYAMHAATRGLRPPTAELVRGGLERGRRMRAVRRVQITGAALAVALLTGTGALVVTTGSHASGPTGTAQQPDPPEVSRPPSATPESLPPAPPLTGNAVLKTLTMLLPAGNSVERSLNTLGDPEKMPGSLAVSLVFRPGGGTPGYVSLGFLKNRTKEAFPSLTCRTDPPPGVTCEVRDLPDGSSLRLARDYAAPMPDDKMPDALEPKVWSVVLARHDGMVITARAANTEDINAVKSPARRVDPVLTLAELEAIVTSPRWNDLTGPGALPDYQGATSFPGSVPSGKVPPGFSGGAATGDLGPSGFAVTQSEPPAS
ncbi:hypothetical protein [Yinghuangia sp. YIM S09857]|uniref:hypothetical protein n=1 Tax=Yinghuangia sp. YIM S09857 TaxID=3436929 RepID=UPI003F530895